MKTFFKKHNITRFDVEAFLIGSSFILVGLYHFVNQDFFEAIVPTWFPYPTFANLVSGGAEIILGFGLILKSSRRYCAWGLLLLLVAVFPANIDMFVNDVDAQTNAFGTIEQAAQTIDSKIMDSHSSNFYSTLLSNNDSIFQCIQLKFKTISPKIKCKNYYSKNSKSATIRSGKLF